MHKTVFTKMNGAGNDFVMLDNRDGDLHLDAMAIARLCDRHRGVGADGVLVVEAAERPDDADYRMRYYNADGGEAEMCGNGARCFARFAGRLAAQTPEQVAFETPAGIIRAQLEGERVRLDMSTPRGARFHLELEAAGQPLTVHFINTGVPHAVVFVEDIEAVDVSKLGAALRYHAEFAPRGTNANFVQIAAPGRLVIRTYERGVEGETLACGTGCVASALVYAALQEAESPVELRVRGGDDLRIGFARASEGEGATFERVTLSGPADFVFTGEIAL